MKLPTFINSIVEEIERLGQIHRQLKAEGHMELIDMYFSRAQTALAECRSAETSEERAHWQAAAESAAHAMRRSADAMNIPIPLYEANLYGL